MNSYGDPYLDASPHTAPSAGHRHPIAHRALALLAALMVLGGVAGYKLVSAGRPSSPAASVSTSASASNATLTLDEIAAKVDPAIVDVTSQLGDSATAAGTGMIISSSGEILTNNHVVAGATSIAVTATSSGKSYPATLLGYDASHDVALLQVAGVSGWPTIHAASASTASVGDTVTAIGNALGKGGTPSEVQGVIQAVDQTITVGDDSGNESETLSGMIAMNADIQPGDSGGATVNRAGDVIGMTTAGSTSAETMSTGTATVGFAVPIDDALNVAKAIESGTSSGTVHIGLHGQLGVDVEDTNGGVAITAVQANSAAANAGLQEGDVIVAVNGQTIATTNDLNDVMTTTNVGDRVSITWQDATGATQTASATLTVGVG
jgi:S1-C subfamily serine protease